MAIRKVVSRSIDSTSTDVSFADLTVDTNTLVVDETNNRVGIGESSPARNLQISDSGTPTIRLQDTGGTNQYAELLISGSSTILQARNDTADGNIIFRGLGGGSTTERMRIDGSGNVGIGTSSPTEPLDVVGTVKSNVSSTGDFNFSATSTGGGQYRLYPDDATTANPTWYHQTNSSEDQAFVMGGVERMRIVSSGHLLIGTTTSTITSATSGIVARTEGYFDTKRNTTSAASHHQFYNPNGYCGNIYTSGSSTVYTTSSDYRLKENVIEVTDGIDRVKLLKPSRFNFIADPDTTVDGFLAHEVQDIVPEAISGTKDAVDEEGNPEYQGIDQSKLVPLLTAALQESIAKIEALEARVAALEST